jgi:WD40 repeat protein
MQLSELRPESIIKIPSDNVGAVNRYVGFLEAGRYFAIRQSADKSSDKIYIWETNNWKCNSVLPVKAEPSLALLSLDSLGCQSFRDESDIFVFPERGKLFGINKRSLLSDGTVHKNEVKGYRSDDELPIAGIWTHFASNRRTLLFKTDDNYLFFRATHPQWKTKLICACDAERTHQIQVSQSGRYISTVQSDTNDKYTISVHDSDSGNNETIVTNQSTRIISHIILEEEKCIVSGSLDRTVNVMSFESKKQVFRLAESRRAITSLDYSQHTSLLAVGTADRMGHANVWLIDTKDWSIRASFASSTSPVDCLRFDPKGERIVVVHSNNDLRIWPIRTIIRKN